MNKLFTLGLGILALSTTPVFAQETPQPPVRGSQQPSVRQVAAKLSEQTGRNVLVTAVLAGKLTTAPETAVTDATLEDTLTALTKRLPDTTWAKVYLPTPADGRRYTGDAVAQFAQAQTGLFGRQNKTEGNTIALLGKQMSLQEAQPYIKGLGLEPYYVVMSRTAAAVNPLGQLAALGDPTGGRGSAAIAALMKKLGVNSPKDIPSGEYDVTVADDSGNQVPAHLKIENTDGKSAIMIRMGNNP